MAEIDGLREACTTGSDSQHNVNVGHSNVNGVANGLITVCVGGVIIVFGVSILIMGGSVPWDDPQIDRGHGARHALLVTGTVCMVTGGVLLFSGLGIYVMGCRKRRLVDGDDVIDRVGDIPPSTNRSRMIKTQCRNQGYTRIEDGIHDAPSHIM